MGQPIATTAGGVCYAFPDVCLTPPPPAGTPVSYPNTGQLSDAVGTTTRTKAGGKPIVTNASSIPQTTGDEAGTLGGVVSHTTKGEVRFTTYSQTVRAEAKNVVRMFDATTQNAGNATGQVLGGLATVRAGG